MVRNSCRALRLSKYSIWGSERAGFGRLSTVMERLRVRVPPGDNSVAQLAELLFRSENHDRPLTCVLDEKGRADVDRLSVFKVRFLAGVRSNPLAPVPVRTPRPSALID